MGAIEATGATAGGRAVRPAVAVIHPVVVVILEGVVFTTRSSRLTAGEVEAEAKRAC